MRVCEQCIRVPKRTAPVMTNVRCELPMRWTSSFSTNVILEIYWKCRLFPSWWCYSGRREHDKYGSSERRRTWGSKLGKPSSTGLAAWSRRSVCDVMLDQILLILLILLTGGDGCLCAVWLALYSAMLLCVCNISISSHSLFSRRWKACMSAERTLPRRY